MGCGQHIFERSGCTACATAALTDASRAHQRAAAEASQSYRAMASAAWEARAASLSAESASRDAEFASWAAEDAYRNSAEQARLLRSENNWRDYRGTAAGRHVTGWLEWAKTVGSERWPAWQAAHNAWVADLEAKDPTEELTRQAQPELDRSYPWGTASLAVVRVLSVASVVGFWMVFDDVVIPANTAGGSGVLGWPTHVFVGLLRLLLVICCAAVAALVAYVVAARLVPSNGDREKRQIRRGIEDAAAAYWDDIVATVGRDPRERVLPWESPDGMLHAELGGSVQQVERAVVPEAEIDVAALPRVAPRARPSEPWMSARMSALLQDWGAADRLSDPYPRFGG